jgi:hypothetical protein
VKSTAASHQSQQKRPYAPPDIAKYLILSVVDTAFPRWKKRIQNLESQFEINQETGTQEFDIPSFLSCGKGEHHQGRCKRISLCLRIVYLL